MGVFPVVVVMCFGGAFPAGGEGAIAYLTRWDIPPPELLEWGLVLREEGCGDEEGKDVMFHGFKECVVGEGEEVCRSGLVCLVLPSPDLHPELEMTSWCGRSGVWLWRPPTL